jgi:hypothetical protein
MLTGFYFRGDDHETWWQNDKCLPDVYWLFKSKTVGNSGYCVVFTYKPR